MFARGEIRTAVHPNATLLPKDAVLFDPGKAPRVFVVSGDNSKAQKAKEREVKIGFTNPSVVEVTNGAVKNGDKVIVAGQTALQDGDLVRVQTQVSSNQ